MQNSNELKIDLVK